MDVGSLYSPSHSNVLYFIFTKTQRVCPPHKPQQTGSTEQRTHRRVEAQKSRSTEEWKHRRVEAQNIVTNTVVVFSTAAQTFCFHSSHASVCRIVRQQLKHKPSADSKDLQFCRRPAQYCSIPSRLRFENGALFGLSWLVRFTFEYIQCCQSG